MPKFPHYKQLDAMDCGPTCLRMVAKYYGKNYSLQYLRSHSYITREGVSMLGISEAAENIGFRTKGYRLTWEELRGEVYKARINLHDCFELTEETGKINKELLNEFKCAYTPTVYLQGYKFPNSVRL